MLCWFPYMPTVNLYKHSTYFQAIRVYFHIRKLLQALNGDVESQLPLTKPSDSVKIGDVLDLSKSRYYYNM